MSSGFNHASTIYKRGHKETWTRTQRTSWKTKDEMAKDEMAKDEMAKDEMAKDEMAKNEMAKDEISTDEMAKDEMAKFGEKFLKARGRQFYHREKPENKGKNGIFLIIRKLMVCQ